MIIEERIRRRRERMGRDSRRNYIDANRRSVGQPHNRLLSSEKPVLSAPAPTLPPALAAVSAVSQTTLLLADQVEAEEVETGSVIRQGGGGELIEDDAGIHVPEPPSMLQPRAGTTGGRNAIVSGSKTSRYSETAAAARRIAIALRESGRTKGSLTAR